MSPGILGTYSFHQGAVGLMVDDMRIRMGLGPLVAPLSPPVVLLVERMGATRSLLNPGQLLDIMGAFDGMQVRALHLEAPMLAPPNISIRCFSMVVAVHGNALGNAMWMHHTSSVIEYMLHGFETLFLSVPGKERGQPWPQAYCQRALLRLLLGGAAVDAAVAKLQQRPRLAAMVGTRKRAALLDVQRKVQQDRYEIPNAVVLGQGQYPVINVRADNAGNATCVVESAEADKFHKNRHVFVPPVQFLSDFVEAALAWDRARQARLLLCRGHGLPWAACSTMPAGMETVQPKQPSMWQPYFQQPRNETTCRTKPCVVFMPLPKQP